MTKGLLLLSTAKRNYIRVAARIGYDPLGVVFNTGSGHGKANWVDYADKRKVMKYANDSHHRFAQSL